MILLIIFLFAIPILIAVWLCARQDSSKESAPRDEHDLREYLAIVKNTNWPKSKREHSLRIINLVLGLDGDHAFTLEEIQDDIANGGNDTITITVNKWIENVLQATLLLYVEKSAFECIRIDELEEEKQRELDRIEKMAVVHFYNCGVDSDSIKLYKIQKELDLLKEMNKKTVDILSRLSVKIFDFFDYDGKNYGNESVKNDFLKLYRNYFKEVKTCIRMLEAESIAPSDYNMALAQAHTRFWNDAAAMFAKTDKKSHYFKSRK